MYRENKFFLKYILKENKKFFIVSVLVSIVRGFSLAFANVLFLKVLFDNIEKQAEWKHVLYIILLYAAYQVVISFIYNWQWYYFEPIQKEKLDFVMRKEILAKCQEVGLDMLDDSDYYEEYKWCLDGVVELSHNFIETWCDLFNHISSIIVVGVVLFQIDYKLVFVNLISFVIINVINKKIGAYEATCTEKLNLDKRKSDYVNRVFYLRDYAKDIRLSNVKDILFKSFHRANENMFNIQKEYSQKISILTVIRDIFMFLVNFLFIILYVVYKYVKQASISLGGVTAVLNSIWRFSDDMEGLYECYKKFSVFTVYIKKVRYFLSAESTKIPREGTEQLEAMPSKIESIEFKDVCFRYNNTDKDTINHLNLFIHGGQKVAIVGKNGNGKSTMIKLLLRLYQPSSGQILINGKDINAIQLESFYQYVGCVFQNFQIYAATVAENIKMDLVEEGELKEVRDILMKFGLYDRISAIKNREQTNLTKEFDPEGTDLSGGQEQRLAVSRMFFKDKNLVVLDEPTSALDAYAEYELNKQIMINMKEKTILLITHRLSTVCDADLILYIKDGRVAELGNHKQLLELNGEYAELFRIQASKYKSQEIESKCQARQLVSY